MFMFLLFVIAFCLVIQMTDGNHQAAGKVWSKERGEYVFPEQADLLPERKSLTAHRPNPFGEGNSRGINTTQMSALTSLASKRGVSPADLIALATVSGFKQSFEELTHAEAIEVIKAVQLR